MDAYLDSLKTVAVKTQSPKLRKAVAAYEGGFMSPVELNRMAAAKLNNSAFFLSPTEHFEVRFLTNRIFKNFKSYENNRSINH